MNEHESLQKYRARLVKEGVLKSFLCGLDCGLGADFIVALVCWLCGFNHWWFPLIFLVAGTAVSTVLFYFLRFRPTQKQIARRVDATGLEERAVTMLDLQGNDSYIARRQREDAIVHLGHTDTAKVKLVLPKIMIALVCGFVAVSVPMTTVVALAEQGVIRSGSEIIGVDDPMQNYIAVTYLCDEGGEIIGETDQLLAPGESAQPVTAVAEDGWIFTGWSDGNRSPGRSDGAVKEELVVTAQFAEDHTLDNADGGDGGEDMEAGDSAGDEPNAEPGDADGNGDKSEGDGQGEGNGEGSGEGQDEGEGKGDGKGEGAGGKWDEWNQIIDGNTYYRDQPYYDEIMALLESDEELPEELKEFIKKYLDNI